MDMVDHGLLLRIAHCTPAGLLVECSLLAWKAPAGAVVWELRRLLEPGGFAETKGLPLKEHIRRNWDAWSSYLGFLGFPSTCLQRSAKSLQARGSDGATCAEAGQEHQLSTSALLGLLLQWALFRRARDHKDRAVALLKGLLVQTVLPDSEVLMHLDAPTHPPLEECCQAVGGDNQSCLCWRAFMKELAATQPGDCPQLTLAGVLLLAAKPCHAQCIAVRACLKALLLSTASCIDMQYGHWGDQSWHKSAEASVQGRVKQRRISTQIKQWVGGSVQEGRFNTAETAMLTLENTSASCFKHWRAADLASLRHMLHQRMAQCRNLSVTMDATRLGRPAQEWLFAACTLLDESVHGFLPPQAKPGDGKKTSTMDIFYVRQFTSHCKGSFKEPKYL
eukprot:6458162-Amphidinium_carterae.1